MSTTFLGIIFGGIIPALFFGIGGVLQKTGMRSGISLSVYMVTIGVAVTAVGAVLLAVPGERAVSKIGIISAAGIGAGWAVGMTLIAVALTRFGMPVSKLVPLYNMNTLVTVLLGLAIYAEWKTVNPWMLLGGAVLIVAGGTLVANA